MKLLVKIIALFFLFSGLTDCRNKNPNIQYDKKFLDEIKIARNEIFLFMSQNYIPGGSFAIAKEGKIIYSEGLGTASKDLKVPVTKNTKFRIGSLSELFTSAIYKKMVEAGRLHPDSTVYTYFPEFPEKRFEIQLKHLVNCTSGLREPKPEEQDKPELNPSILKGIDDFKNDTLIIEPGILQIPSPFNYNLLGAIMEKATHKSYSDLLKLYITDTLKLSNTLIDNPLITIEERSDFYIQDFLFQVLNAFTRDLRYKAPSEGILSNAEDLVKFGNAILFSDYFPEETRKEIFEPPMLKHGRVANMSHGWILIKDREGRDIYGRSSKIIGGTAALAIYPKEQLIVAFAVNMEVNTDNFPVFSIASHFLPPLETETGDEQNIKTE